MQQQTKTIEQNKKRLYGWLKAVIPESYDLFDLQSEYDSSLTYLENKNIIRDKIRILFANEFVESKADKESKMRSEQDRLTSERNAAVEAEIKQYNDQLAKGMNKEILEFYKPIHRTVDKMCAGYCNLAFIKGRGAIGKSFNIRQALLRNKVEPVEISGDITEAYLYRLLFENNGRIFWFKDVSRLLAGVQSTNLIKAATETEDKRLLTKNSYSKQQDDLPDKFIFSGKIIFDYNEIAQNQIKEDFEALITRGDYIEINLSMEDVKEIMGKIAKENWQKEVTDHLIKNYEFTGYNLINLRTQYKAFKTYNYCKSKGLDWKSELSQELKNSISKVKGMLYSLIGLKAVRTSELKKLLLKYGMVNTLRTADNKVKEYLELEEIYRVSSEDRNFYVSLKSLKIE